MAPDFHPLNKIATKTEKNRLKAYGYITSSWRGTAQYLSRERVKATLETTKKYHGIKPCRDKKMLEAVKEYIAEFKACDML